jgi:hypothetical protein
MPWVGFEPTIPVSERAKTFYALRRVATVVITENHKFLSQNSLQAKNLNQGPFENEVCYMIGDTGLTVLLWE